MKNYIEGIKEFNKKPYGKPILFFGFYFILFTVLLIMINSGSNDTPKEKQIVVDFGNIEKYNYSFEYKILLDGNTYIYSGNKDIDVFNYTYNGIDYYYKNGKSYLKDDIKEIENPMKFDMFFKENMLEDIIKSAYVDTYKIYDSGEKVYNLLISSNELNELIDNKNTDIDEIPNKIKVSMNYRGYPSEINYDLNSYCINNNLCKNNLSIIISYKEFSSIS
ncbi:MAG: hypothetical protein IK137_04315 [Bacilli bacterium]|nr:hypothetical protein [Bacilli bacterium]